MLISNDAYELVTTLRLGCCRMLEKIKQLFGAKPSKTSVTVVADRFKQIFSYHGIEVTQIPRIFSEVKLADLQSDKRLMASLSSELLVSVAQFFGVRIEWLEGVDDRIYEHLGTYKDPTRLFEKITDLSSQGDDDLRCPLQVLTTSKQLDRDSPQDQYLAPVIVEKIADLGDETIYRYHIFQDAYYWQHKPARIELKAIAKIIFHKIGPVPLLLVSETDMQKILGGKMVPRPFLHYGLCSEPSLEDYSLSQDKSPHAKETDELPEVLAYIEKNKLQDFVFNRPLEVTAKNTDNLISNGALDQFTAASSIFPNILPLHAPSLTFTPKTGKRASANAVRWAPIEHVAKAIWDQEKISITEMVARIKNTTSLSAAHLSDSAIRKHIAKLAPEGIAGKRGRKPKK